MSTKNVSTNNSRILSILFILLSFVLISACATLLDGTKQKVQFDSKPQGTTVLINGSPYTLQTPFEYEIPKKVPSDINRDDNEYVYTFKKEGYLDKTIRDKSHYDFGIYSFTNLFFAWGYLIDYLTCADQKYSENIFAVLELDNSYINFNINKLKEDEGIVFGEIKFLRNNLPINIFNGSVDYPTVYFLPVGSRDDKPSGIGQFNFTIQENVAGFFSFKLPRGSYSLTHMLVPSMKTYFSPFDSTYHDSNNGINKVDIPGYLNFDVTSQNATYIGSISIEISNIRFNPGNVEYVGFIDKDESIHYNMLPGSGGQGLSLSIGNNGQISGMKLTLKDYELLDEKIKGNEAFLTFRDKAGSSDLLVWKTSEFYYRSKWSVSDENTTCIRLFHNKFSNFKSDIVSDPLKIFTITETITADSEKTVKFEKAQPDSIFRMNQELEYNDLNLRIKDAEYGNWRGMSSPNFKGWKIKLEIENKTNSLIKMKLPRQLINSGNSISSINLDRTFIESSHLIKFGNKVQSTVAYNDVVSEAGKMKSGSIVETYIMNGTEIVLKSTKTPNNITSDFFNEGQINAATLNQDFELEVYPNITFMIDLFYNGDKDSPPQGLIMKQKDPID